MARLFQVYDVKMLLASVWKVARLFPFLPPPPQTQLSSPSELDCRKIGLRRDAGEEGLFMGEPFLFLCDLASQRWGEGRREPVRLEGMGTEGPL